MTQPVFSSSRPAEILIVDDTEVDRELTRLALLESELNHNLHMVESGPEALSFLRGQPPFDVVPQPDLILLDLNMPGMNGHEVLQQIKADETLRSIPVLILSTSDAPDDIHRAYDSCANTYLQKPMSFDALKEVTRGIREFWFQLAELPGDAVP